MPVYRIVDNYILSQSEYQSRSKDISDHLARRSANSNITPLSLSKGRALSAAGLGAAQPTGFQPVGLNRPLTVVIRDVYTGRYPERGLFKPGSDLAVVSGVKNYSAFDASARGVNFIKKKVADHAHLQVGAFDQGTAVIANSPAITADSLALTIEFAIAEFPKELIDHLAAAFQSLAGVPVMMPFAGYLLGAHSVIKLASGLADALFGHKVFSFNDSLNFDVPGSAPPTADFRILCNPGLQADEHHFQDGVGIVDRTGNPYRGDEPYVVISLDGKDRPDLKTFTPTVASAAVLEKFFQIRDGAEAAIDTIVQGIKLASDMKYRNEARELKHRIDAMPDGDDKKSAQARYEALSKNVLDDALKP